MRVLWPILMLACSTPSPSVRVDLVPRVVVETAGEKPASVARQLRASAEPWRDVLLSAVRGGVVQTVRASVGEPVAQGDAILELDAAEARANVRLAQAARSDAEALLSEAESSRDRVLALGTEGASDAQRTTVHTAYARAVAGLERAGAQLQLAQVNLGYMTLDAPFDGEVAAVLTETGALVGPGTPAVRLVDLSARRIELGLQAEEAAAARSGDVAFEVAHGSKTWPAELTELAGAADPRSRTWFATLRIVGEYGPDFGQAVDVTVRLPLNAGEAVVSPPCIDGGHVWVVEDGVAQPKAVTVVGEVEDGLLVTGVSPGDTIVRHADDTLQAGQQVTAIEASR